MDYTYNIRDWLTGINNPNSMGSDHFGMTLGYTSGDEPAYNGNISEMYWKTGSFSLCEYQFDYNGANRLTDDAFTGTGHRCITQQMSAPTAQGNRPQKDFAGF